jgi:hypothetical protein
VTFEKNKRKENEIRKEKNFSSDIVSTLDMILTFLVLVGLKTSLCEG